MGMGPEMLSGLGSMVSEGANLGMDIANMAFRGLATAGYANAATGHRQTLQGAALPALRQAYDGMTTAHQNIQQGWGSRFGAPGQRSNDWAFGDPTKMAAPDLAGDAQGNTMGGLTGIGQKLYRDIMVGDKGVIPMATQVMDEVRTRGDNVVQGLTDDVGARLSQFSTSLKESLTNADAEVDAAVASGGLPPAAAAALKQQNKLEAAAQTQNAGAKLMVDFQEMKTGVQLQTMNTLASTGTALTATIAQARQAGGAALMEGFKIDRETEQDLLRWDQDLQRSYMTDLAANSAYNFGLVTNLVGMMEGMDRTTASMLAGIPLSASERTFDPGAPLQTMAQGWMNRRAANEAKPDDEGWF